MSVYALSPPYKFVKVDRYGHMLNGVSLGMLACPGGFGHMEKMATMPIQGTHS